MRNMSRDAYIHVAVDRGHDRQACRQADREHVFEVWMPHRERLTRRTGGSHIPGMPYIHMRREHSFKLAWL